MSSSNFDLIMQDLLRQKQVLEDLEAENQELRRQLAELRAGRGIFVEILGTRFALHEEEVVSPEVVATAVPIPPTPQAVPDEPSIEETPTTMIEALPSTTPIPQFAYTEGGHEVEQETLELTPAFMEEMLFEEFTSASTNATAVWSAPGSHSPIINDDEKATLRRELMGSFLLE